MAGGLRRAAGWLVVGAALLLVFAAPASATFQGADGKIFFVSDRDGNNEIYSMTAAGGSQTNLTNNAAADGQTFGLSDFGMWEGPTVSPDGKKVAFTSTRSGNKDIWIMNADGSSPTNLTSGSTVADFSPAFTFDGKIVFMSDRTVQGTPSPNLWKMDADGSNVARIPGPAILNGQSPLFQPDAWPDPTPEVYLGTLPSAGAGSGQIFFMLPGQPYGSQGTTTGCDYTPEFSHDVNGATTVFYTRGCTDIDIYEAQIGATGTAIAGTPGVPEMDPAQSPSRSTLAYVTHDGDWEITAAPGGQLTSNATFNDTAPEWQAVDNTPPDTVLEGNPPASTADNTPTFQFSSTEANSTFKCSIDLGTAVYGDCSGPGNEHTSAVPLADGDYKFHVRATDSAGNPDPSPVEFSFTVDTQGPVVDITKAPKRKVKTSKRKVTVKFEFEADENATFECTLDGNTDECTSPASYKVNRGSHTFTLVGTDTVGNIGDHTVYKFKVLKK